MKRFLADVFVLVAFAIFSYVRFTSIVLTAAMVLPLLVACLSNWYRQTEGYKKLILGKEAASVVSGIIWFLSCVIGALIIDSVSRGGAEGYRALQAYIFAVGYCGFEMGRFIFGVRYPVDDL